MTDKTTATATAKPVRDSKGRFIKAAAAAAEQVEVLVIEEIDPAVEVLVIEEIEPAVEEPRGSKRGAKPIFEKRDTLIRALRAIKHGDIEGANMPSRYHQHRLADAGLVMFETVQSGKRGRPQLIPHLTREGVATLATM
jgi:hypothetical protein